MKTKKGKRLVDVLDEQFNGATGEFLKAVTDKFVKLFTRVTDKTNKHKKKWEDDVKWCTDMIDTIGEGTIPTKLELERANDLWRMYK